VIPHIKLPFPPQVPSQHLVVLGKTGAGKSSVLRVIVEYLLHHKKRVCIVDIKGDWYGLKSSADGKSAGFPVIAFGDFREPKAQDVPINQHSGKHVAELITSGNRPCIIGFRGWMPGQITDFWLEFAPTLFNKNEGELYVVISECHNFAPKGKVLDPKAGKVLHWTNRLLSEGRGLGMTFLLDSQRPQKVHNDTLTSCETLIGMRVVHKADRDAIEDWIIGCGDLKLGKEVLNSLAQLARGEAWVWSPEIGFGPERIQFPMFETFDSFAPAQLQKKVSDSGWSSVDLEAVKTKLATVIEEAKGNDPAELKARIRQLEQEARTQRPAQAVPVIQEKIVEIPAVSQKHIDSLNNAIKEIKSIREWAEKTAGAIELELRNVQNRAAVKLGGVPVRVDPKMPRGQIDIHDSRGRRPAIVAVAFLAGYTVGGGAFNNPRGALRQQGLIDYRGDGLVLTDKGRQSAHAPDASLTTKELHDRVLRQLPGPEQKILSALLLAYPDALQNDELARRSGYEPGGGAFNNPRGRLKSFELIEYPERGMVRAADLLFLN